MNPAGGVLYRILEWITRFAYLHILWFLFTCLGGIILGLFPATITSFGIIRKWLQGNSDLPLFQTFWTFYKKEFLKSNLLGLFIVVVSGVIVFNLIFLQLNISEMLQLSSIPFLVGLVVFLLFVFYIFPAYVHFDVSLWQNMKNAFLIMLISPFHSLMMIICLGSLYFVYDAVPALAFICGSSTYAFISMWLANDAFQRIAKKQKTVQS
ncbi:YesL family protein [Radiobacillus kanasensis]|uniref:YesL family protein n=1 Tax=Radiobacillus kanasensis TaxID=2844358 RepID=UPI001E6551D6|nr:YesL family protein [Radiobacillus kanasensis]UFT98733.1 YesL family protein [Radiobacillus kanasensis]